MKRALIMLLVFLAVANAKSQQNLDTLHQLGKNYMRNGDWGNAVMVLKRALQQHPGDAEITRDIAYTYYLQKDFSNALATIQPLIEADKADVACYQIAGTIYRAIEDFKQGKKLYQNALKKFPFSAALYSEYGELLWDKKDYSAIEQWETGILADANFSGNYYNAARYYYFSTNKTWSLIYSEIFLNLESYTIRTAEIKNILFDSYKKLFTTTDLLKEVDNKKIGDFEKAYLTAMATQSNTAATGITPEKLIQIRKAFLTYWFAHDAAKYPFRLFDYQKQLVDGGMFEAYNQWLFGGSIKPEAYQQWIKENKEAYDRFSYFQKGRVFKLPKGQYYQNK